MNERNLVVVSAGLGTPSSSRLLADQLAVAVREDLERNGVSLEVRTVELRDLAVDIANNMVTGFAPSRLAEAIKSVEEADGLIVVTPVFTASYSGLFKSFFDVIDNKALEGKPVLIGATGGTSRHSMVLDFALRPLFAYLCARTVPTAVYAAPEDWGTGEAGVSDLASRIRRAGAELAAAIAQAGAGPSVADLGSLPFEELMARTASR